MIGRARARTHGLVSETCMNYYIQREIAYSTIMGKYVPSHNRRLKAESHAYEKQEGKYDSVKEMWFRSGGPSQ